MARRILILLGDAGGGHMSAARALEEAFLQVDPSLVVKIHNLSDKVHNFPFNATDGFWKLVSRYRLAEMLSNTFYWFITTTIGDLLARRVMHITGSHAVKRAIRVFDPDIIVSTHFIVSCLLEEVKPRFPGVKTISVATDLVDFPRLLADRRADLIFCATGRAARRLEKFGVPPEVIRFPAFPVPPKVARVVGKNQARAKLGLHPTLPTVLVTGGGLGTVALLPQIKELLADDSLQIVIICGKSAEAYNALKTHTKYHQNFFLEQMVFNMEEYISACDIVVAKPGPATIVEIEAQSKKAVFSRIIGTQENGNILFLKQNPNFTYLPEETKPLAEIVREKLASEYIHFSPRFDGDASIEMVTEILTL